MNATGESDLRNYYDRLSAIQEIEMEPAMARLDECIIRSALGTRDPDIYYDWAPLWALSEKEQADIFKTKADGARAIAGTGTSPPLMPIDALSDALVNTFVEDGSLPGLEAPSTSTASCRSRKRTRRRSRRPSRRHPRRPA